MRDLETQVSGERGQPPAIFCRLYVVLLGDLISKEQLEIYFLRVISQYAYVEH